MFTCLECDRSFVAPVIDREGCDDPELQCLPIEVCPHCGSPLFDDADGAGDDDVAVGLGDYLLYVDPHQTIEDQLFKEN